MISGPLWSDQSQSVAITCGGFWTGAMRFAADRAQLSVGDMTLLARLQLVDGVDSCSQDVMSLSCRYGSGATYAGTTGPITPDPRCWHGMFTPNDGTTIARSLSIAFAREVRRVELDECADPGRVGKVSMHVLEPGASPLAVGTVASDPGSAGTCARLEAIFPHAGS